MYTPKNPIGKRKDGTFATVNMMTEKDRGQKCNLKCPNPKCNGNFQFVMGNEDSNFEPYFRHDGKEPCNASVAFMAGLYGFLEQCLLSGEVCLPTVFARIPCLRMSKDEMPEFVVKKESADDFELFPEQIIEFDCVGVQYEKDRPVAIIASNENEKFAFVMNHIEFGCVTRKKCKAEKYQDFTTISVQLEKIIPENVYELYFSEEMMTRVRSGELFKWVYHSRWCEKVKDLQNDIRDNSHESKKQTIEKKNLSNDEISNEEKVAIIMKTQKPLILWGVTGAKQYWRVCQYCFKPKTQFSTIDGLCEENSHYLCVCHNCAKERNIEFNIEGV